MKQRRHEITNCIKTTLAGGTVDCHDHAIADLELAWQDIVKRKDNVSQTLQSRKAALIKKEKDLKTITATAALSKMEMPRLRSESHVLRGKINDLTLSAGHWDNTCKREEQKIAHLEDKLTRVLAFVKDQENELRKQTERSSSLDNEIQQLGFAVDKYEDARSLQDIIPADEKSESDAETGPTPRNAAMFIEETEAIATKLKSDYLEINTFKVRIEPLKDTINHKTTDISVIDQELYALQQKVNINNSTLTELTTINQKHQNEISGLKEKYDAYDQLLKVNRETEKQYSSLVDQMNGICTDLRDALVENSSLELSLRFEDMRANLLTTELDNF